MLYVNNQFNIDGKANYGDKSISHRALILASIAKGKSTITNLSLCKDVFSTIDCLKTLGAKIDLQGTTAVVTPIDKPNTNVDLYCGNSGTTARLIAGLVVGLNVEARFYGDDSLCKRSMDELVDTLSKINSAAKIKAYTNLSDSKRQDSKKSNLFLEVCTLDKACDCCLKHVSKSSSAQVKSAALIAALNLSDTSFTYTETIKTRNHTELLLKYMGAKISSVPVSDKIISSVGNALDSGTPKFEQSFVPQTITLSKSTLSGCQIDIPNDISSAAYLIALSLLTGKKTTLKNIAVNEGRIGLIQVLQNSGANIVLTNKHKKCNEDVADIMVEKSTLKPLYSQPQQSINAIDEILLLAAIACFTKGTSTFCRVQGLKNKESDRIETTIQLVRSLGQTCTFDGKNLTVVSNGKPKLNPYFKTFSDHRIAMTAVICSIALGGGTVDDDSSIGISFPNFYDVLGVKPYNFALFGSNIGYTLSPILMEYFSRKNNISCRYSVVDLKSDATNEVLSQIKSYDGANITTPFKTRVAHLYNATTSSVNTVGTNVLPQSTDTFGLLQTLNKHGFEYKNKQLWVIGAGGAAEACIDELSKQGATIQVFNRTQSKADYLTQKYNLSTQINNPIGILSFVPACDYLKSIQIPQSVRYVFSASYVGQNALIEKAQKRKIPYAEGLEMLFYQGAKSFSLWTNSPIDNDFDGFFNYLSANTNN